MTAAAMIEPTAGTSPRFTARMGGLFWLLTVLTGAVAFTLGRGFAVPGDAAATAARMLAHEPQIRLGVAANLVSGACYVAATLFVYELLKPVNRSLSLLAAFFSLVGCAAGAVGGFLQLAPLVVLKSAQAQALGAFTLEQLQALAFLYRRLNAPAADIGFLFFALHCLLVGYLILRSTFLPRIVGALMVGAGLGWLTFCLANLLSPPLARALSPYILIPGMLGEALLSLWLLVMGVQVQRWREQAGPLAAGGPPWS